jgi:hypothetical protein
LPSLASPSFTTGPRTPRTLAAFAHARYTGAKIAIVAAAHVQAPFTDFFGSIPGLNDARRDEVLRIYRDAYQFILNPYNFVPESQQELFGETCGVDDRGIAVFGAGKVILCERAIDDPLLPGASATSTSEFFSQAGTVVHEAVHIVGPLLDGIAVANQRSPSFLLDYASRGPPWKDPIREPSYYELFAVMIEEALSATR